MEANQSQLPEIIRFLRHNPHNIGQDHLRRWYGAWICVPGGSAEERFDEWKIEYEKKVEEYLKHKKKKKQSAEGQKETPVLDKTTVPPAATSTATPQTVRFV